MPQMQFWPNKRILKRVAAHLRTGREGAPPILKALGALPFLAIAMLPSPVTADELVGGWEGGPHNGYGFASPTFAIPLTHGNEAIIKPTAGYLYYDYRDAGGVTNVTEPKLSLEAGYRYSGARVTATIGPMIEVLWERKVPQFGPHTDRTHVGAALAGDLYLQATRLTSLSLGASYDAIDRYSWGRASVKRRVTDLSFSAPFAVLVGAEVTGQGNKDVGQFGGGGIVEFAFDKGESSVQIHGGYSELSFSDHSTDSRPYIGVGLYHHF